MSQPIASEAVAETRFSRNVPARYRRSLSEALEMAHGVDAVAAEERAASLAKRSLKKESKVWGLKLAISMIDLTTLEGKDTRGKVLALCNKAIRPDPSDPTVPHVAAVCVYPTMVPFVKQALKGTNINTAAVATGFPSGQTWTSIKVQETRDTVAAGADEIDMVIDRGAFLSGDYQKVFDEIAEVKEACGPAHLKVILETGELANYDQVRRASLIAMYAGADFIKTSTGKVTVNATLPVTLVMFEAIRDFYHATGKKIGMKPAGGISNAKLALAYLVLLYETLGGEWMNPDLFRLGASSLLNDILMQLRKERTGAYQSGDYFTLD
jgi:deoxyribose-phosphate aldolase